MSKSNCPLRGVEESLGPLYLSISSRIYSTKVFQERVESCVQETDKSDAENIAHPLPPDAHREQSGRAGKHWRLLCASKHGT